MKVEKLIEKLTDFKNLASGNTDVIFRASDGIIYEPDDVSLSFSDSESKKMVIVIEAE